METLRQALDAADEAYLIGMSNKGLYKRACKDITDADMQVQYTEQGAEVQSGGETCHIVVPLWESRCSCPAQNVCRHLLGAILWLKQNCMPEQEADEEEPAYSGSEPPQEEVPVQLPPSLCDAMRETALLGIRTALGRTKAQMLQWIRDGKIRLEEGSVLTGYFPDSTRASLLYPLERSTCSCGSMQLCSHKAAVLLAWRVREEGTGLLSELEESIGQLPAQEQEAIHICAAQNLELLGDILRWGLVRMPERLAENLEIAAVRCHSLKLADAERAMRDIGKRLADCRSHRAAFQPEAFLHNLCGCSRDLQRLQKEGLTRSDCGTFRAEYIPYDGDLTILPLGQRHVETAGYAGEVYYFLNMDTHVERPFLSFSDIRPTFYEGESARKTASIPWGMAKPLHMLMRSKMVLQLAKVSDGKLSSSKDTQLVSTAQANLNCEEVRRLVYSDFRRLAVELSQKQPEQELDRLCLLHPAICLESGFDPFSQQYRMVLADRNDCRITLKLRYTAKDKELIEQLESIGKKMQEHPENSYLLFAAASLANGELTLMPIDFYDFIQIYEEQDKDWMLPPEYAVSERSSGYIREILELFEDVEAFLCELLQSGLQSAYGRDDRLAEHARRIGLYACADRIQALTDSIQSYRHSMQNDCGRVLDCLTDVYDYLHTGRQQLEVRSALVMMKGSEEI